MNPGDRKVARWESKGGSHIVELWKLDGSGWYYRATNAGGYLGNEFQDDKEVIESFLPRVNDFQPDKNVTPMRRISL
jgi:hypothetical protein